MLRAARCSVFVPRVVCVSAVARRVHEFRLMSGETSAERSDQEIHDAVSGVCRSSRRSSWTSLPTGVVKVESSLAIFQQCCLNPIDSLNI